MKITKEEKVDFSMDIFYHWVFFSNPLRYEYGSSEKISKFDYGSFTYDSFKDGLRDVIKDRCDSFYYCLPSKSLSCWMFIEGLKNDRGLFL